MFGILYQTNETHEKVSGERSGLDSRLRGRELESHRCHFAVVLEQDTFILA